MKLLFVITEDWYFVSHRLPLAMEAKKRGWDVVVATRVGACREQLEQLGIRALHIDVNRGGLNPVGDIGYFKDLLHLYREERPDMVHHVAMKPCLYGSLAAWRCKVPCVVNALAGMGFLFSSSRLAVRLIRGPLMRLFGWLFNRVNSFLILQNPNDVDFMERNAWVNAERIRLIRGSGVDLAEFCPAENSTEHEVPVCVMVSRLLRDKGVVELIEAARILKERACTCRIILVGDADLLNPNAIDQQVLDRAVAAGCVEWVGRRSDIAEIYRHADIAVLPSYREGLPKSLVEAAACGLPIVTTDVPGCREVVEWLGEKDEGGRLKAEDHGPRTTDHRPQTEDGRQETEDRGGKTTVYRLQTTDLLDNQERRTKNQEHNGYKIRGSLKIGANGVLVPARDAVALADAIELLVRDADIRRKMGHASRALAVREFGIKKVVDDTFRVYGEMKK